MRKTNSHLDGCLSGSCLCGAVTYQVTEPVDAAFYCHCRSCRKSSGAPYVAWGRVPEKRFKITSGTLTSFTSSPGVTRHRCTNCGTEIFYAHEKSAPNMDFLLATLDDPSATPPTYHVRTKDKLSWTHITDGLEVFSNWRE